MFQHVGSNMLILVVVVAIFVVVGGGGALRTPFSLYQCALDCIVGRS